MHEDTMLLLAVLITIEVVTYNHSPMFSQFVRPCLQIAFSFYNVFWFIILGSLSPVPRLNEAEINQGDFPFNCY